MYKACHSLARGNPISDPRFRGDDKISTLPYPVVARFIELFSVPPDKSGNYIITRINNY